MTKDNRLICDSDLDSSLVEQRPPLANSCPGFDVDNRMKMLLTVLPSFM